MRIRKNMESFLFLLNSFRCLGRGDKESEKNGVHFMELAAAEMEVSDGSLKVLSPALMDKYVRTTFSCFAAVIDQRRPSA